MQIGPHHKGGRAWRFTVWAPRAASVDLALEPPPVAQAEDATPGRRVPMAPLGRGYWTVDVDDLSPGQRYRYALRPLTEEGAREPDGEELLRADPASHYQPEDVHGPSALVDLQATSAPPPTAARFTPPPLESLILYELHVGTFTSGGTLDHAIERLDHLLDLGVTGVELMPLAQFPGGRNWGYDGVYPFAVHKDYGGPAALRRFVAACHARGLAVVLDVVYNHLGPEGNYLRDFGPYFTDAYKTPWGEAVNFDGAGSDGVRNYFIQNALHWLEGYGVDALRLDAVHAILDTRPIHFLAELADAVRALESRRGRRCLLIAESDLNDARLVRGRDAAGMGRGGLGQDGVWCDDFHHALHARITGEQAGYYMDFGTTEDVATAWRQGYVYTGRYSPFRDRGHGGPCLDVAPWRFVVCAQNHDQVGNRMLGERLAALLDPRALRPLAAAVLLAPQTPLLFMGEEYGETNPFLYFISHLDEALVEAVRQGRAREFAHFFADDGAGPPDPQSEQTFRRSTLAWSRLEQAEGRALFAWHKALIALRKTLPPCAPGQAVAVSLAEGALLRLERPAASGRLCSLLNLEPESARAASSALLPAGAWRCVLDAAETRYRPPSPELTDASEGAAAPPVDESSESSSTDDAALPAYGARVYLEEKTA